MGFSLKETDSSISVVLTSHNYARFLPQAIEAILSQSLQPNQFIIIDDASSDESVRILREYTSKHSYIRLIENERNKGVIACLNHGLDLATGRYLVYATADDLVLPGFFERSVSLLQDYPRAAFCSSLANFMDESGKIQGRWPSPVVGPQSYINPHRALGLMRKYGFWLMGNTVVFRREMLIDEGGFICELGPLTDSIMCQVLALRHGACFIPEPLACWRKAKSAYSYETLADPNYSLEILGRGERLMRSAYKDLFPNDYIKRWKREKLYDAAVIAAEGGDCLAAFKKILSPLSRSEENVLSLLKPTSPFRLLVLKLYLLVRFRLLTWDQIRRRVQFRAQRLRTHKDS